MKWRGLVVGVGVLMMVVCGGVVVGAVGGDEVGVGGVGDKVGVGAVAGAGQESGVGVEGGEEVGVGLRIGAVSAGFSEKVEGVSVRDNWDFVEIVKVGEGEVNLLGWGVRYVASSGGVRDFALTGVLTGEALLLRYSGSPQKDGNFFYGYNISAVAGRVELVYEGEVVDSVEWEKSGSEDGRFGPPGYLPVYDGERNGWRGVSDDGGGGDLEVEVQCLDLQFSEIYSYFVEDYGEQFVEIYNPTDEGVVLDGCAVRYKGKDYALTGEVGAGEYLAYRNAEMRLTKNPTSSNYVELVDVTGEVVASAEWWHGQRKGASWMFAGVDAEGVGQWRRSYRVTAGEENVWQEFRSCPTGKVINPATGNCISVLEYEELPECPAGKFRNPETNRCKSFEVIDNVLTPCKEGQYRNPETNRCKSLASLAGAMLVPCKEGYERNPETNRCRKIRENNGADYGVAVVSYGDKSTFMAYGALAVVGICGVVYIIWQFREEIGKPFRLIFDKIRA